MAEGKKRESLLQRLRRARGSEADKELREAHIVAYACGRVARAVAGERAQKAVTQTVDASIKAISKFFRSFRSGRVSKDVRDRAGVYNQNVTYLMYGQTLDQKRQLDKQLPMGELFASVKGQANNVIPGAARFNNGGLGV